MRKEVPEAYYSKAEKQMIEMCRDLADKHPEMGAIMLECTGMQPFAREFSGSWTCRYIAGGHCLIMLTLL